MDLSKHQAAFNKMNYDDKTPLKPSLRNTKSTIIVTESADLDGASDFIANILQSEDPYQIRTILVQASVELKLLALLESKLKPLNTQFLDARTADKVKKLLVDFFNKGFTLIKSVIVRCPQNLIPEETPVVNLEIFRTTKEGVSFAKTALSIGLWCENISIAFEYINSLSSARQVWLNSSHGVTHPKIPLYNGQIVCDDSQVKLQAAADVPGSTVQVTGHVQFISTFRANTFQTVVIPFSETFAN